jgi:hypothetical protein
MKSFEEMTPDERFIENEKSIIRMLKEDLKTMAEDRRNFYYTTQLVIKAAIESRELGLETFKNQREKYFDE